MAVYPMHEVRDLAAYRAVVLGSAIQNRQWLPEASQFVQTNQNALREKPVATFTICLTLAMRDGEKYRPQIAEWLAPVRSLIHPLSEGILAGALDIGKIPSFSERVKFRRASTDDNP